MPRHTPLSSQYSLYLSHTPVYLRPVFLPTQRLLHSSPSRPELDVHSSAPTSFSNTPLPVPVTLPFRVSISSHFNPPPHRYSPQKYSLFESSSPLESNPAHVVDKVPLQSALEPVQVRALPTTQAVVTNTTYNTGLQPTSSTPHTLFDQAFSILKGTAEFILTHSQLARDMAPFLRQLVAGPRVLHEDSGLDLCYVTPQIIVTSGPAQDFFKSSYRNPLPQLLSFINSRHKGKWAIWEFRAEGTGYPDEAVENRIHHYPWSDHQPPPFRLVPLMMASMRNWLKEDGDSSLETSSISKKKSDLPDDCPATNGRVVIVHCKAGKGRSGSVACSYLISECGWQVQQALDRFTSRRIKPGYGEGVSIPSQLRWIDYVERWTRGGKKYVDRAIEIVEIRTWGLKPGVKLEIKAYADEGKKIEVVHRFRREEREVVPCLERDHKAGLRNKIDSSEPPVRPYIVPRSSHPDGSSGTAWQEYNLKTSKTWFGSAFGNISFFQAFTWSVSSKSLDSDSILSSPGNSVIGPARKKSDLSDKEKKKANGGPSVIFRPKQPVRIENNDVQVSLERRSFTPSPLPFNAMTSLAYVWFNAYFEGDGESGVFEVPWEAMDGVRGSAAKGGRALDRMEVVWRVARDQKTDEKLEEVIEEPKLGENVPEMMAADWTGALAPGEKAPLKIKAVNPLAGLKSTDVSGQPL